MLRASPLIITPPPGNNWPCSAGCWETRTPIFSGAAIASVSCRFFGEGQGDPYFGGNYYDFTYFDADNRMQFSCIVNGYTGKILYLFGNLPGEGNG